MPSPRDYMELAALLATEPVNPGSPHLIADDADDLIEIAQRVKGRAVRRCNGKPGPGPNMTWDEWGQRLDRADYKDEEAGNRIMTRYCNHGAHVILGGDPRGYTLKLVLASGRTNEMGGEGWGVPTS